MARTRNDLSQEQADLLLEQHKQELEILSRSMDVEKQRQLNSLSDKIAERKKRKAAALEQRHQAEMSKELMNQQNERRQVQDDKVRENWHMKYSYWLPYISFKKCRTILVSYKKGSENKAVRNTEQCKKLNAYNGNSKNWCEQHSKKTPLFGACISRTIFHSISVDSIACNMVWNWTKYFKWSIF